MFYQLLSVLAVVLYAGSQSGGSNLSPFGFPKTLNKVRLDVYYESLCPDSIRLYRQELYALMKILGRYIHLHTYPYGKASTNVQNGEFTFRCQHGERECYGNKLHACAIELIVGEPSWLDFNACLLYSGSNDTAADFCGGILNIFPEPVKTCAKDERGTQLLMYHGEESSKVSYSYIPHVLINGRPMPNQANLLDVVRSAIYENQ